MKVICVVLFTLFTHVYPQCIGTCYSGSLFPETQDIFHGKHLKGHSYKNITNNDQGKCYRHCVQDCRCKACQMKDATCELLDEDKTSKTGDFVNGSGYVYFDLRQTMYQGQSHMVQQCYNGCCKSNPCLNGGQCIETCNNPKSKFVCQCQSFYSGKVCQLFTAPSSCQDILQFSSNSPSDGVYKLTRDDTKAIILVYCSFSQNQSWTLLESFKYALKSTYQTKAFNQDFPRSEETPNWDDYRLSLDNMKYLRDKSSKFRATCSFLQKVSSGDLNPDYMYGSLSDYDFINKVDSTSVLTSGECARLAYINIRGNTFHNVNVEIWSKANSLHTHVGCNHHSLGCAGGFVVPGAIYLETCFGLYFMTANSASTCSSSSTSTTQWWLGA